MQTQKKLDKEFETLQKAPPIMLLARVYLLNNINTEQRKVAVMASHDSTVEQLYETISQAYASVFMELPNIKIIQIKLKDYLIPKGYVLSQVFQPYTEIEAMGLELVQEISHPYITFQKKSANMIEGVPRENPNLKQLDSVEEVHEKKVDPVPAEKRKMEEVKKEEKPRKVKLVPEAQKRKEKNFEKQQKAHPPPQPVPQNKPTFPKAIAKPKTKPEMHKEEKKIPVPKTEEAKPKNFSNIKLPSKNSIDVSILSDEEDFLEEEFIEESEKATKPLPQSPIQIDQEKEEIVQDFIEGAKQPEKGLEIDSEDEDSLFLEEILPLKQDKKPKKEVRQPIKKQEMKEYKNIFHHILKKK